MIYALIIIYNKKCDESISLKSVLKRKNTISPIVFDNSDKAYGNKECCSNNDIEYFSQNTNLGISKAYNYVIDNHKFNNNDYLMILDDDTCLTDEYFAMISNMIEKGIYDVIFPIVVSNNRVLSPSRLYLSCLSHPSSKLKQIDYKHITAINSGMVIRCSIYKKIRYNENLFLDFVDHDFVHKLKDINANIIVADCKIYQKYSNDEKDDLRIAINRFKIYLADFYCYCNEYNRDTLFSIYSFKHALQLTIRYNNPIFIRLLKVNHH